ncbi:hypothetical protein SAMN05216490_0332 [Mucilaginibacter mallensis]|uniref:Uncharacterized protein n=1 Tax=Mucilaginibacter mallensis TaxID=652787 RepID=A0A1H1NJJ2_MUCMA|nr:hypothetical protein SAMN05216490_0332 [Mucilaginibacter mallensis]
METRPYVRRINKEARASCDSRLEAGKGGVIEQLGQRTNPSLPLHVQSHPSRWEGMKKRNAIFFYKRGTKYCVSTGGHFSAEKFYF